MNPPQCIHRTDETETDCVCLNSDLITPDRIPLRVCIERCPFVDRPVQHKPGVGDLFHRFTKAVGVSKVADLISNGKCGCGRRMRAMNKWFSRKK